MSKIANSTFVMPTSAAEKYLSTIAPEVELQPCDKGFRHTVRVCMGAKNPHEIGRRYAWVRDINGSLSTILMPLTQCHGGNRECNVKGPVLSVDEQDVLRKKVTEFKARLKADKQEVSAVRSPGVRVAPVRKRGARSLPEATSDDESGQYSLHIKQPQADF